MPSRWKTVRLYTMIVLGSVITAVGLAEWYLASRAQAPWTLPFYNRLYPYVMFRPPEHLAYISAETFAMSHHTSQVYHYTNEDGFRTSSADYELPKQKPAGQLRIAVLGGSAVQLGSTYETTLPGSLKTVLQQQYPGRDIEVLNAGIQSSVSRQSIAQLVFTVVEYEPDIVILYDGANDIGMPLIYDARPNFPYNFQTMQEAWDYYRQEHREPLYQVALNRSYLYAALRTRFGGTHEEAKTTNTVAMGLQRGPNALAPGEVAGNTEFIRGFIAAYLSNWKKLIELSAVYGYEPVCILQPSGGLDREYAKAALLRGFPIEEQVAADWVDAFASLYEEAIRQIEVMRTDHPEAVFVDLSTFLQPAEEHFWDGVHVYDETNMMLAERIHQDLEGLIRKHLAASHSAP